MKSSKLYLIVAASVVLLAVGGLLFINNLSNIEEQATRQEADELEEESAPDTILPRAKHTVLKMDGQGNSDVYLQSLDIQVEVTGNIASTRYTMVFKNKTDRV